MRAKKKVAILDSSFSALPILESINKLATEIFIVGSNENDFLCKFPSITHICMDYSDAKKLSYSMDTLDIDFVIPGCNDVSYQAYEEFINRKLSTTPASYFCQLNNKNMFRKLCHAHGINSPLLYEKVEDAVGSHVIVKPEYGFSGNGITECNEYSSPADIQRAMDIAQKASSNGKAIIEQFISGQLFSISIFITNSEVKDIIVVKEFCLENKYAVNWSYVSKQFHEHIISLIGREIARFPFLMNVENGLLHLQCILDEGQEVNLIEATRRCPGDLFPILIQLQTGKNYAAEYLKSFIPCELIDSNVYARKSDVVIRHTSTISQKGFFKGFNHHLRGTILSIPTLKFGEINHFNNKYRSGVHFYSFEYEPTDTELMQMETEGSHSQITL